jgi:PAS domain S-box-containing protein
VKTPANKQPSVDDVTSSSSLEDASARQGHFFDISQDVFVVTNMTGKILLANPAHKNVLGTDFNRVASFIELVHPDDRERAREHLGRIREGQASGLECRSLTQDGTYKWMSWLATPVPSEGLIYGIGRDISLRKAAELRASQMADVLERASFAVIGTDRDYQITSWNRGAEVAFGYTPQESEGMRLDALIEAVDKKPPKLTVGVHQEHVCVRKDGTTFFCSGLLSEVQDESGACVGYALLARDISERKDVERRVKEFYSMISHELRTPLASIRGVLGLIAGGLVNFESAEGIELINAAKESSDRLIRLINNILDLQKIESGKLDIIKTRLNPEVLSEMAIREVRWLSEQCGVQIRMECEPGVPGMFADRDKVTQVLTNLLSNAIKFSPAGETVELRISQRDKRVHFAVSDRGAGIPPEHSHKLFEKFQQIDSSDSRKFAGSGLGLAICKALVEAHKGTIGYCNEPVGCTFWFELPADTFSQTAELPRSSG